MASVVVPDTWQDQVNEAIKVMTNIPQTNQFTGDMVFVRSCYPSYYSLVLNMLKDNRMVSVTGTPGIGKNIFYLYFFDRYRKENPAKKVLTASFSAFQVMEECTLYPSLEGEAREEKPVTFDKIPRNACDLYLYDGPPEHKPPGQSKMVAFTAPHPEWLDKVASKYEDHQKLFMPNWDAHEQRLANDVLSLGLTKEVLEKRRALFGNTARYTLTKKPAYAAEGARLLYNALGTINSLDSIKDIFDSKAGLRLVSHRLLHYEVDVNNLSSGVDPPLIPASRYVAEKMEAQLQQKLTHDREKLQHMLDNAGKASAFAGWIQENVLHEKFLEGGDFPLRSLGIQGDRILEIKKTQGFYKRFKIQADVRDLLVNAYKLPDSSTLESVDSYYFDGEMLWLFQITSSMDHGVKLMGLLHLVEYLKLKEKVRETPSMVKLVFVTPGTVAPSFRRQDIVTDQIFENGTDFAKMDCSVIPGVGKKKRKRLEEKGLRTVDDLLKAPAKDITLVKMTVENFKNNLELMKDADLWSNVEQFVLGVERELLDKLGKASPVAADAPTDHTGPSPQPTRL